MRDAYLVAHIYIFFVLTLWDYLTQAVYALPHFMLGIYSMTVSQSSKEKQVLPDPRYKRLHHINNLRKRRLGTIMHQSHSSSNLPALFLMSI